MTREEPADEDTHTILILDRESYGGSESNVFLELKSVLQSLPDECHKMSWAAFDLWIEFDADELKSLSEIVTASESDGGARMSWAELWSLAQLDQQVVEGQFIGYRSDREPPDLPGRNPPVDTQLDQSCRKFDLVLEAIDSSFWKICSRNKTAIERMRKNFKEVEVVTSS